MLVKKYILLSLPIYIIIIAQSFLMVAPMLTLAGLICYIFIAVFYGDLDGSEIPFIIFPFSQVIRANNETSLLLTLTPEITAIIGIILFLFTNKIYIQKIHRSIIFGIAYMFLVVAIIMYHAHSTPVQLMADLRRFVFPISFIIFIILISKNHNILRKSFVLLIISFSTLSLLALLNYYLTIFNSNLLSLSPYIDYNYETSSFSDGRTLFGQYLPRMSLLLPGMIGSVAGVYVALSIYAYLTIRHKVKYVAIGFMTAAAFMTLSVTPVIIVSIFFAINLLIRKDRLSTAIYVMIYMLLITGIMILYVESSWMFRYAISHVTNSMINIYNDISLSFIFGYGPSGRIEGVGINSNQMGSIDIGLFRVLYDFGIIAFIFIIGLIFNCIKSLKIKDLKLNQNVAYLIVVISCIIGIHGPVAITSPVFLVFSLVLAALIYDKKRKTVGIEERIQK